MLCVACVLCACCLLCVLCGVVCRGCVCGLCVLCGVLSVLRVLRVLATRLEQCSPHGVLHNPLCVLVSPVHRGLSTFTEDKKYKPSHHDYLEETESALGDSATTETSSRRQADNSASLLCGFSFYSS